MVFRPQISRGGDTTDFGHVFSNYTYFRPRGRIWLSYVQRARRLEDEIKKIEDEDEDEDEDEESQVKYKSCYNYVGRPNNNPLLSRVAVVAKRPIVIKLPVNDLSVCTSVRRSVKCIVEKRRIGSGCRLAS